MPVSSRMFSRALQRAGDPNDGQQKLTPTGDPGPERPRYGSGGLAEGFWIDHMGAMIRNLWRKRCCVRGGENALLPQTQFTLKD